MAGPRIPKYQAIHERLRTEILAGDLAPGSRLPPQSEMAERFGVTLMTLRQAVAALEADGLVRAERGRGTFVAERPVDIRLGNLSSFAEQMAADGVEIVTEVVSQERVAAADHPVAATALGLAADGPGVGAELWCLVRRRRSDGEVFALQRSFLDGSVELAPDAGDALYAAIEAATGATVVEARETMSAVGLDEEQAALAEAPVGHPALRSERTSLDQFGRAFLHDDALLIGGRCSIAADRRADRLSLAYGVSNPG